MGSVATSMPLAIDRPIDAGIAKFCDTCRACRIYCPADAVPDERSKTAGKDHLGNDRYVVDTGRWAIAPNGRLLLIESVIPDDDRPDFSIIQEGFLMPLGGVERTGAEYSALLEAAGFRLRADRPDTVPPVDRGSRACLADWARPVSVL